ncbi:TPA: helix-turn-helix transcriptional regulator [Acinetobacter baumannii]|uniref:helix-turn-helix domain-containing protein n=1 Tax=Acinetobacter TaxID=469 RepID=UPI0002CEAC38|nr:helix-turn-helix transcriptional regulator [Acinetobacter baumannii]EKT7934312.1 helix-turn-helix transcriptional regulator [Acinetobacter baumannii]EKT8682814.1 helix-turn-helix transcriptional regulator [Acinetobacter baumannii]EKT9124173.1 helix-turn-helix transcriptional regulator [Acinetobacter baumannii]EKT9294243.1 helix-turn-helix transcriptional regulator [Acinetobacter baumannii]EKU3010430.1 helix-turn-helix transcriptional regulator [Acinetobacter baumannii]
MKNIIEKLGLDASVFESEQELKDYLFEVVESAPCCDINDLFVELFPEHNHYQYFAETEQKDGPAMTWESAGLYGSGHWIGVDDGYPHNKRLHSKPYIKLNVISIMVRGIIGHNLYELRRRSAETIDEVAAKTDLNAEFITNLENGSEINPTLNNLKTLAKHFNTSVSFLVDESETHKNSERYLWLKHHARNVNWLEEDGTYRCERPALDLNVDRAIKNTAEALAKRLYDAGAY